MDVNLQVVGIFYNVNLSMPDSGATVKDLMDAAQATPNPAGSKNGASAFSYTPHSINGAPDTMYGMSATYESDFSSRVLENVYPAGTYALNESFDPGSSANKYSVWQYYMFDADGKFVNTTNEAQPFSTQSLDGIARVSWRLVTILSTFTSPLGTQELMLSRANPKASKRFM